MIPTQASLTSELKQLFESCSSHPINRFYKWIHLLDRYEKKYLQLNLTKKDFLSDFALLVIESANTMLYNLYQNHFGKKAWGRLIAQRIIKTSKGNNLTPLILMDYPRSRWQIDSIVDEQDIIRNIIMNTSDRLIFKRISNHAVAWDFLFQEWSCIWAFSACLYCRPLTLEYFLARLDSGGKSRLKSEFRSVYFCPDVKSVQAIIQTIKVLTSYGTYFQDKIEELLARLSQSDEEYINIFLHLLRLQIPLAQCFFERWRRQSAYPRYYSFIKVYFSRFESVFTKPIATTTAANALIKEKEWDQNVLNILNPLTYLDKYLLSFITWLTRE